MRRWLDSDTSRRIALLWAVAIFIRLLLMPFSMHFDAYQIYSRAAEAAYGGEWFGWSGQFLVQTVHNLWLFLIRPLIPDSAGIWSDTASIAGVGASHEDYQRFLAYDHVFRLVFLLKLPYVVVDLVCGWMVGKLVAPAHRLRAMAFWLLNPLVIFATTIYARHDVFAIALVFWALLMLRRQSDLRRAGALVLMGIATLTRFFPVLLLPVFLLAYRRTMRQLAISILLLGGLVALVEFAGIVLSGKSPTLTILDTYIHFRYWLDADIEIRFNDFIFIFPVVYAIGLLWLTERGVSEDEVPALGAVIFLVLFSLTFFHPHYAIWLVPFLALTITGSPRMLVYHLLQIACLMVYFLQWGTWTTWGLFEPLLGERAASLPDPYEFIAGQIEPRIVFGMFRSLLTAVSLWMAWTLLRPIIRRAT